MYSAIIINKENRKKKISKVVVKQRSEGYLKYYMTAHCSLTINQTGNFKVLLFLVICV